MLKFDVFMWTKNGSKTLPIVLKRLNEAIPEGHVNSKVVIDDKSEDNTQQIAEDFRWQVMLNKKGGIPNAANLALELAATPLFLSFEQDVLLNRDWLGRIIPHMSDPKTVVAHGLRLSTVPVMQTIEEYAFLIHDEKPSTIDNNVFRTEKIREIGGFPNRCPVCTDRLLKDKLRFSTPYKWVTDRSIISLHLKKDVKYELNHFRESYSKCKCESDPRTGYTEKTMFRRFFTSPIRAGHIMYKKHNPSVMWFYPAHRFTMLLGFLARTPTCKNETLEKTTYSPQ